MTSSVATAGQSATIFFCVDGSDPRLLGGAQNAMAQTYASPIILNQVVTVKARAKNRITGEWSPLTEATFAPAAVPGSSNNLVVAELMYHPPDVTAVEMAAGWSNADDFEFVRLVNIGPVPVDLSGVRFTLGITFDFSTGALRYLTSGASVLVVKNRAAFQLRYGHSCDALIAGEAVGNFSNGGERIRIVCADNSTLRDFSYGESAPWPTEADGHGPSLLLLQPSTNPDPAVAANWTSSVIPGGSPGGIAPHQSYAAWRMLYWNLAAATNSVVSGPDADPDSDGIVNFLEYAFGLDPHQTSTYAKPVAAIEIVNGQPRVTIAFRLAPGAEDSHLLWEISNDLRSWGAPTNAFELLSTQPNLDGTAVVKYSDPAPLTNSTSRFVRLRIY
jgi:hypothetical protein